MKMENKDFESSNIVLREIVSTYYGRKIFKQIHS